MVGLTKFILLVIIVTLVKVFAMPIVDVGEGVDLGIYSASVQILQFSGHEPVVRNFLHKK